MKKRQIYYYSNMSPFAVLGLALLVLGAFFLTLPIFIAAFVIFGAIGSYMAWRLTRAIKKAEEEMLKRQQQTMASEFQEDIIIDITPGPEDRRSIEHGRF